MELEKLQESLYCGEYGNIAEKQGTRIEELEDLLTEKI